MGKKKKPQKTKTQNQPEKPEKSIKKNPKKPQLDHQNTKKQPEKKQKPPLNHPAQSEISSRSPSISSSPSPNYQDLTKMIEILQDDVNIHIILLLLTHKELNLSEITNQIDRTKATVSRHIKILSDFGLINKIREEKVRGVTAHYYSCQIANLSQLPTITPEKYAQMSPAERRLFAFQVKDVIIASSIVVQKTHANFSKNINQFAQSHPEEFSNLFNLQNSFFPILLNMNILSESQFHLFQTEFRHFMMDLYPKLLRLNENDPGAIKPYLLIFSALPQDFAIFQKTSPTQESKFSPT